MDIYTFIIFKLYVCILFTLAYMIYFIIKYIYIYIYIYIPPSNKEGGERGKKSMRMNYSFVFVFLQKDMCSQFADLFCNDNLIIHVV